MEFRELSEKAKKRAYGEYVKAMNDDLNREYIMSIEDYEENADWDMLEFDKDGNYEG